MRFPIVLLVTGLLSSGLSAAEFFPALNIGYTGLTQKVLHQNLAPGVQYFRVLRGQISPYDFYTLSSGAVTEKKAQDLLQQLRLLGHSARKEPLLEFDPHGKSLGAVVRTGHFTDFAAANAVAKTLWQSNLAMAVRFTAEDGGPTSGPFDISVLRVDLNQYQGQIISVLGRDQVSVKEKTSSMAKRHNALAAVNAGFFSWKEEVGSIGDPAGIAIIDGELVSEATDGRAALIIRNGESSVRVWVAHNVISKITLEFKEAQWLVNGLNRKAGIILNCGNQGAEPVTLPVHDFVCTNANEIVLFDHHFGDLSEPGEGFEFTINDRGEVVSSQNRLGGIIPVTGYLVQAKGEMANRLRAFVKPGMIANIHKRVMSAEGEIPLIKGLYAVNGGPTLLRNGQMDIAARFKEGWETDFGHHRISDTFVDKKDTATVGDQYSGSRVGFYNGWVVRRHPRTAIGITSDNVIYVVVVYGRQPGITAGASLTDITTILQNLGATEAFNLDGGGSTTMVVNGKLTGPPSDKSGERPVGDALIFTK